MNERFGTWRPAAVVFDCDGLLMDTETCWSVAETEMFARRGLSFGTAQKAVLIGKAIEAVAVTMAELFDEPGDAKAIEVELLALVTEVVTATAEAMPGAHELVERVRTAVPVAVASNSPRALLDAALARGQFEDAFDLRFAADEVQRPKPDPEMYLTACAALHVAPTDALAFEDSMTGVRSACAAGLRVVGVPTLAGQELSADVIIDSLEDPNLRGWIERWADPVSA